MCVHYIVYLHTCIHTHIRTHTYIHIYIHTYIYIYIYIYIYYIYTSSCRKKCLSVAAPTDHDVSANVLPNIYEASPAQVTMQDHAVIEETFLVHTNF